MAGASTAFPFLTIPDSAVQAGPWTLHVNDGDPVENPEWLEGWDYNADLHIWQDVELDMSKVQAALKNDHLFLGVVLRWGTAGSNKPLLAGILARERASTVLGRDRISLRLEGRLPGSRLAGQLFLETLVVLQVSPLTAASNLSPRNKGDILWQDRIRISLEGARGRFPVSESGFPERYGNALWFLEHSVEAMDAPLLSSVRLYLNACHEEFVRHVARERDPYLMQAMMADVAVQMIGMVMQDRELLLEAMESEDTDSVGWHLRKWILGIFGSAEEALRSWQGRRGEFHARINSYFGFTGRKRG